ncbi:MAG: aromatic amino acid lyase [Prevotellamassilia sp.]|nr:aromatic amino acid lyase [Prevotellamassilia sp.]MDD7564086.1 aromatic amino acid ammonia-lyase [Prevotellamassilia sp.]MDY4568181.1 aromatic amino acid ammonia-lyase [Alloprevotella sp.]MDY5762056.1 aromatic amino acid ammonia-lyase [Alloprevotella sp.]MDY6113533.1 aromatic amino acid ammonia-lyase [Alloprevotella sp.]
MISVEKLKSIVFAGETLSLSDDTMRRVAECYDFLCDFARDKVIYGINTGFGPMAQWRVSDEHLKDLQYNIIRSHATGMGQWLDATDVKAALVARLGTFAQARSGVHPDTVKLLLAFINNDITPCVPRHGSVGASGDLVQLAHVALALIGEGEVMKDGKVMPTAQALEACGLQPLKIYLREGLALTNGTAFMTGIAAINQIYAESLLSQAVTAAVWLNEVVGSIDDFMAAPLNEVRRHHGQQAIAARLRRVAEGSRCLQTREHALYDGAHRDEQKFTSKVQPYYSLRCIPQIYGPVAETLEAAGRIIDEELNSACDNPIVDPDTANVYHGGNFHGDYISLEEDKVKIAMVRVAMTAERQLNYLLHDRINELLPPFLNMATPGLDYALQAYQFTATSTTAECQTLAMPNYVHSIPNNHDNQDIVSMGTNTALLTRQVVDNTRQVMAILYVALAQATDCMNLKDHLAPVTRRAYDAVRALMPTVTTDRVPCHELAAIETWLRREAEQCI